MSGLGMSNLEIDPKEVHRIDRDVTSLTETVIDLNARQASMITAIDNIAGTMREVREEFRGFARDTAPKPVSVVSWIGVLFALFMFVLAVIGGGVQYVTLQLTPIEKTLGEHGALVAGLQERELLDAHLRGQWEAKTEYLVSYIPRVNDVESDVSSIRTQVASNSTGLATLVQLGSRKWISGGVATRNQENLPD